ncbi:MAG TPA: IPTL-CTERM sorting domain-containing protein [Thermoanaerobaculia bacterium]|nr:IPTL-CTERM sorting domain-containing protein [Thermoanaerobaculia bacterium]
MSSWIPARARIALALLLLTIGAAPAAHAVTSKFQVLLDLDNHTNTGCDVPALSGTFNGVERILITTVDTGLVPPQVTKIEFSSCISGTSFTAPTDITPPGVHPIGVSNGTGGTSVIETTIPLSLAPVAQPPIVRLGVLGFDSNGVLRDEMLKVRQGNGNGPPILLQAGSIAEVPTLSEWGLMLLALALTLAAVALLRRRTAAALLVAVLLLGLAGMVWAAASDLNGTTTGEWNPGNLLATEPTSDAPAGADIRALYGFKDTAAFFFRIDAQLLFDAAPIAVPDTATVSEDTALTVAAPGVLANDSDPDGPPPLTAALVTGPSHALSFTLNADGSFTYTPAANYNGPDSFTYQAKDGLNVLSNTATVSISVTPVDDPPVAVNDSATVTEDDPATAINVLANDTDIDGGPKSIASVTQPANGVVAITGGGTGLTYKPNANYCNNPPGTTPDTFTYTLSPAGPTPTATVSVTVTCVDDPPVAVNDSATVTEDDPATAINVLANDTDVDGGPKSIASVTQPANGVVVITGGGTGLTYQPNANYCNTPPGTTPDTFTYTLSPAGPTPTATVSMSVTCVDDAPVAVNDTATVTEDSGANAIDVLANDTDIDGGPKSVASVTQPANGVVAITGGGTGVDYTPNANYCQTNVTTAGQYRLGENDPGALSGNPGDNPTVALIGGVNLARVGSPTYSSTTPPAITSSLAMSFNGTTDAYTASSLVSTAVDNFGIEAWVRSAGSVAGNAVIAYNGSTVASGWGLYRIGGSYGFSYGGVTSVAATPLVAGAWTHLAVVRQSGTTTFYVNGFAVTTSAAVPNIPGLVPSGGMMIGGNLAGGEFFDGEIDEVRIFTFAPGAFSPSDLTLSGSPTRTSPDTFTYTLSPAGPTPTATVSVTVTCVDDPPVAVNDSATVAEDAAATTIDVLANDTDVDGGARSVASVTQPANGSVVITGGGTGLTYKPNADYCNNPPGTSPDTFTYTLTPGSSIGTVSVTVNCVDDPPVAINDSATVAEDDPATAINVLANDTDVDGGPKSIASVTQPANGVVVITGGGTGLTYKPNANYCNTPPGTTLDTFTYTLSPAGPTPTATVTVTVTCVDDPPVAVNDSATVTEDDPATAINVLANDTDIDGGPKSIASVTQPANGVVVITGGGTGLTYKPNANYCNNPPGTTPDTFTYTLSPAGPTPTATVSVLVTCVDDPPVAVNDSATVTEDDPATAINVLANDTDVDGGPKSIASVTQPANGVVVITGGGTGLTYKPNANYCNNPPGTTLDTFTYTLTPAGPTPTAMVTVTVTCVDDPPVAVNDSATVTEDDPATAINVLANDTDIDGGPKSIASVTQPANGVVVITGGGTGLTYKPNANYCNNPPGTTPDTFTYTLTPAGPTPTATVSVLVTCVNDPPVAGSDTFDFIGNTELRVDLGAGPTPAVLATTGSTFGVLNNDSDPVEGDAITVTGIVGCADVTAPFGDSPTCATANGGTVVMESNGRFSYKPKAGDTAASDSFQYTIQDNGTPAPAGATGTVTLRRLERVWYVKNNAAAGGLGRSHDPFDTLAEAETASSPNDYIFVYLGDGTSTGQNAGILLKSGQHLIGEHAGLTVTIPASAVTFNGAPAPTNVNLVTAVAGNRPLIDKAGAGNNAVSATDVIPVEIVGLSLSGGANAIDLTTGVALPASASLLIKDNIVRSAGAEGMDISLNAGTSGTLTLDVQGNSWTTTAASHVGNAFDARTAAAGAALRLSFSNNTSITSSATGVFVDSSGGGSITITGFANNTVHQNTLGTGISITGAKFDANPGTVAYDQVSGGTTVLGASGNGVGASGLVLTGVSGDLAFTDLDVFADGGAAVRITGTGAVNTGAGTGTRVTVGAGVAMFEAIGGPAVDVTNATIDLQPTSIKSTNSATTGVSLDTITGTFAAGSGSAISNATGTSFNVNAGTATISYDGTITNSAGRSVSVTSKGSGSTTFNGTITGTGGTGIFLNSNTGSTISFTKAISLTTGANDAFTATGGGTVTATDTTSTITTTTGTAINVANTTIGAGGLKFASVSAGTAASGPASGIVLNNTGASGSLAVNGGTIQKTTSHGVSLTSTLSPSFSNVNIQNTARSGIKGNQVNGFTLTNSTINNSGTAAIAGSFDSNVAFNDQSVGTEQNLTGTVSITGNTLTNAQYHGVDITNFNGTIADLTLSSNTITSSTSAASSLGSGIDLQALGSTTTVANVTKATIANNVITNFPSGAGIQALGANANAAGPAGTFGTPGSGTNVISITGNRIAGQSAANKLGTNGILVSATGKGQANFDVSSNGTVANPLANIAGFGIGVSVRGAVTVVADVTNNVLAPNNTFASPGISVGADSLFAVTDAPDLTSTISNNNISQSDGNGILATVRNSNGIGRYKIQNNTVAAPLSGVRPGIRVDSGTASGNTTVCLNMSGNTSAGSGGSQGLGLRKQGTVTATNAFGVNGMAATSSPGVETYIDGLNPAGNGTLLISATSGFSNCSLP